MEDIGNLIAVHGVVLVFVSVLLDQLGIPAPAVPVLIVAGAFAADGRLPAYQLFAVGVIATLMANCAWYFAGRHFGNRVTKTLCRVSLTPDACVGKAHTLFERWGMGALVMANFLPGISTVAPPLAGALGVGWVRFLFFSTVGAILWVGTGLGVGIVFHEQIEQLLALLERLGVIAIVALVAILATYIGYKWWERRRFFSMLRMARIGVDELYSLVNVGAVPVIVDVRSQSERALQPRRIPGAVHVPLHAISRHARELPRDREVVLYCTCPNEVSAAEATKLLIDAGIRRVRPLHGGLDAWIAAGYAVEET